MKVRGVLLLALAALAALAAAGYVLRERLVLAWLGSRVAPTTVAARAATLAPYLRVYFPGDRAPPYPVVVQFHGCGGLKPPFQEQWAHKANEEGWMAVAVDSYAPRGITRARALETVCNGKELIGQERAGDVAAALEIVRARKDVDPSRIVLAGWSHGAWTVMDFLALDGAGKRIPGLTDYLPGAAPVAGAFLLYPYCGLGAWTYAVGWKRPVPTLALIAGADTIVDPKACPPLLARIASAEPKVVWRVYPKAEHAFDDAWLPEGWTQNFDAAARDDAAARYKAFLSSLD